MKWTKGENKMGIYGKNVTSNLCNMSNKMRRKLDNLAPNTGLSGAQSRVLHYVIEYSDHEIFQKDVMEAFGLRSSTATELLKKMEDNGLIQRIPCPYDARLKRIVPSEAALEHKEAVEAGLDELEKQLTQGISREDLEQFNRILKRMISNIS